MAQKMEVSYPSPADANSSVARLTLLYVWEAGAEHMCHSDPERSEGEESRSDPFFPGGRARTRARFLATLGMTQTLPFSGFLMPADIRFGVRVAPFYSTVRRRLPTREF